jgi:hypothetical protein
MSRSIHHAVVFALLAIAMFALQGCPKKGAAEDSGEQVVEAPKSRFSGATKAFVEALTAKPALVWTVEDAGVAVVYDELFFAEDGTFEATVTVRFGGADAEPFTCSESGAWDLDDNQAESKTVGMINFHMTKTDCAGREAPMNWRARTTLKGDVVNFEHR